jgi:hypothetical protein
MNFKTFSPKKNWRKKSAILIQIFAGMYRQQKGLYITLFFMKNAIFAEKVKIAENSNHSIGPSKVAHDKNTVSSNPSSKKLFMIFFIQHK